MLPPYIAWSFPSEYDLGDRKQLRSAYERVMTEGLGDDVRFYIDIDVLLNVWDELWLSPHVRDAWYVWLRRRRLVAQAYQLLAHARRINFHRGPPDSDVIAEIRLSRTPVHSWRITPSLCRCPTPPSFPKSL